MANKRIDQFPQVTSTASTDLFLLERDGVYKKIEAVDLVNNAGITIDESIITTGTAGRILFESATNKVSQNSNLIWDTTNNRLGLGQATPTARLHAKVATTSGSAYIAKFENGSNEVFSILDNGNIRAGGSFTSSNLMIGNVAVLTGSYNTVLGVASFQANTTGSDCTAVGYAALQSNTEGSRQIGIGQGAGSGSTTGTRSIYIGVVAGASSNGSYNTVIGDDSFGGATGTASYNTIIGNSAGRTITANYNTGLGSDSLESATSGSQNTACGALAGFYITTSQNNVYMGYDCGPTSGFGAFNASIGIGATVRTTAANQLVIGGQSASVNDAYIGNGVTNTSASNIVINATGGSGSNNAGANLTIAGGKATGNAAGGYIDFQTSDVGASGSTLQSLTSKMRLLTNGSFGIGVTSLNASAILQIDSTTQGVLLPRMTTTEINAISTPANSLLVYNTTIDHLCFYQNGTWEKISHTNM